MLTMPTTTFKTCPYCAKEIDEEQLDVHTLKCGVEEVECGNDCETKIPRWIYQQHKEESCKKRKVQCNACSAMILFKEVENHKWLCSVETMCPLECGFRVVRSCMAKHMFENCPVSLVACRYCTQGVRRLEMDKHVAKCKNSMRSCGECGKTVQKEYMDCHLKQYCVKPEKVCVFCDVSVAADTLKDHYDVCDRFLVHCDKKCGHKIERRNLNEHSQVCPKRLVMCEYCQTKLEFALLEIHRSECSKFAIPCSENGGKTIPREILQQHLDEECEKLYAPCDYKDLLCIHEDFPAGTKKHMQENVDHHIKLVKDMIQGNVKNHCREYMTSMTEKLKKNKEDMIEEMQNLQEQVDRMQEYMQENFNCHMKLGEYDYKVEENVGKQVQKLEEQIGSMQKDVDHMKLFRTEVERKEVEQDAGNFKDLQENTNHEMECMKGMIHELQENGMKSEAKVEKIEKKLDDMMQKKTNEEAEKIEVLENGRYLWKITDIYSKLGKTEQIPYSTIYSSPFYTSDGYKFKLSLRRNWGNVYPSLNQNPSPQISQLLYSSLGIFIHVMPGEFDSILKWPAIQHVTLKVFKQNSTGQAFTHIFPRCSWSRIHVQKGCNYEPTPLYGRLFRFNQTSGYIVNNTIFLEVQICQKKG